MSSGTEFKKQYGNEFYKVLPKSLNFNEHVYQIGENIATGKLVNGQSKELFFITKDNIAKYFNQGGVVSVVEIDDDSIVNINNGIFCTNKFTITKFIKDEDTLIEMLQSVGKLSNKLKMQIMENAAENEYFKILQWLLPKKKKHIKKNIDDSSESLSYSDSSSVSSSDSSSDRSSDRSSDGDSDCKMSYDDLTLIAGKNGNIKLLKLVCDSIKSLWIHDKMYEYAAKNNHFEFIKLAREIHTKKPVSKYSDPWNHRVCSNAATKGNLDMLKWLICQDCPVSDTICYSAALSGNIEMLEWLVEKGYCLWNKNDSCTTLNALHTGIAAGHTKLVQWILEKGVKLDQQCISIIAMCNRLDILQLIIDKDYEFNVNTLVTCASMGNRLNILKLLKEKNIPYEISSSLFHNGSLQTVQWAMHNGYSPTSHDLFTAINGKNNDVVWWLKECGISLKIDEGICDEYINFMSTVSIDTYNKISNIFE